MHLCCLSFQKLALSSLIRMAQHVSGCGCQLVQPVEATTEQLRDVHTEAYLSRLHTSSQEVATVLQLPPLALLPHCLLQRQVR